MSPKSISSNESNTSKNSKKTRKRCPKGTWWSKKTKTCISHVFKT